MGGGSVNDQDLVGVGPGWVALPTLHILAGAAPRRRVPKQRGRESPAVPPTPAPKASEVARPQPPCRRGPGTTARVYGFSTRDS